MSDTRDPKACFYCKFWSYDMDDEYCAHTVSFAETSFGRGLNYMRGPKGPCGSEGKLFEHSDLRWPKQETT